MSPYSALTAGEMADVLRGMSYQPNDVLLAAANRLVSLDAVGDQRERELRIINALRPPCPTCGGTKLVDTGVANNIGLKWQKPCPENGGDCDGKVSIEQLVEFWVRKHQPPQRFEIEPSPPADEGDLQSVKP